MVVATNPRVTGGIEVRYWSGVDRMAIPKLTGHGDDFAPRLTDLFVRVVSAALKGYVTSADPLSSTPSRSSHGRLRLSSWGLAQAQGRCRGRRHRQEVRLSRSSHLPTMSQIFRKKKSKSKSKLDDVKELDRERVKELLSREDISSTPGSASGSNRASPSLSSKNDRKTDAERRFEEAQRRRVSFR